MAGKPQGSRRRHGPRVPPGGGRLAPPPRPSPLEHQIQSDIHNALSRGFLRVFRCNVGTGWAGGDRERRATLVTRENINDLRLELRVGDAIVPNARPLHAGLQKGNGDLIGWQSVTITPEMVGETVAIFTSIEVKTAKGAHRAAQNTWREQVLAAGGIAFTARSVEQAKTILKEMLQRLTGQG